MHSLKAEELLIIILSHVSGYQEYYADEIADQDSIVLGIVVKGVTESTHDLQIITTYGSNVDTKTVPITVSGTLTPVSSPYNLPENGSTYL